MGLEDAARAAAAGGALGAPDRMSIAVNTGALRRRLKRLLESPSFQDIPARDRRSVEQLSTALASLHECVLDDAKFDQFVFQTEPRRLKVFEIGLQALSNWMDDPPLVRQALLRRKIRALTALYPRERPIATHLPPARPDAASALPERAAARAEAEGGGAECLTGPKPPSPAEARVLAALERATPGFLPAVPIQKAFGGGKASRIVGDLRRKRYKIESARAAAKHDQGVPASAKGWRLVARHPAP